MNDGSGASLNEAFNDCIDRLNAGQNLDDCLARYPQWAAELRPLLLSGLGVQTAQAAPLEVAVARARQRARLARALERPAPVQRRRVAWSPLALAASLVVILAFMIAGGGVILSAIQNRPTPTLIVTLTPAPTLTFTPTPTETETSTATQPSTVTQTATPSPSPTPTDALPTPAITPTPPAAVTSAPGVSPSATGCVATLPDGWVTYRVQGGDTLSGLAVNTGTTADELRRVNCLEDDVIVVGELLYLPRTPVPGPTTPPTAAPTASGGQPGPNGQPTAGSGPGNTNANDNVGDDHDDSSNDNGNTNDNVDDHSGSSNTNED